MSTLICPVTRKVACDCSPTDVLCELVNWSGVPLMLHRHLHAGRILGAPEWTCSHEPTGHAIAHGSSPEVALCIAVEKLRRNYGTFRDLVAAKPILNP